MYMYYRVCNVQGLYPVFLFLAIGIYKDLQKYCLSYDFLYNLEIHFVFHKQLKPFSRDI